MPESIPKHSFFEALQEKGKAVVIESKEVKKLAKKHGVEVLGYGAYSTVVEMPGGDKVFAISKFTLSPAQAKKLFYRQRILHTFFPHNFPRFHGAFGEHPDPDKRTANIEGTVRKRIEGVLKDEYESPGLLTKLIWLAKGKTVIKYPFKKAEKVLRDLGIPISHDTHRHNLMIGKDGGEYFVDDQDPAWRTEINVQAIITYMEEHGYSEGEIKTVVSSFKRLETLDKEGSLPEQI